MGSSGRQVRRDKMTAAFADPLGKADSRRFCGVVEVTPVVGWLADVAAAELWSRCRHCRFSCSCVIFFPFTLSNFQHTPIYSPMCSGCQPGIHVEFRENPGASVTRQEFLTGIDGYFDGLEFKKLLFL